MWECVIHTLHVTFVGMLCYVCSTGFRTGEKIQFHLIFEIYWALAGHNVGCFHHPAIN